MLTWRTGSARGVTAVRVPVALVTMSLWVVSGGLLPAATPDLYYRARL
jgi:hypothetical protein